MDPLVYHEPWAGWLFFVSLGAWLVGELALQAARQGERGDPSYLGMVAGSIGGTALAFVLGTNDSNRFPGPPELAVAVGVALMWAGMAFRYWSVRVLGRAFKVTVTVDEDQPLVERGPYSAIRHPSYTGMVVVYLGIGIALDSWLGALAALLLPTIAVVRRVGHEERVLREAFGDRYAAYSERTHRLLPGVW
jgi:protein-S-isoprenylcysteine O-methyltransferase Ste14